MVGCCAAWACGGFVHGALAFLLETLGGFWQVSHPSMISNERPSPFRPRSPGYSQHQSPFRRPVNEDTLKSGEIQLERKTFVFLLKENPRGRFLRIIEQNGKHSDSIIIPSAGLETFQQLLAEMTKAAQDLPTDNPSQ
jgi:hypothetical protein